MNGRNVAVLYLHEGVHWVGVGDLTRTIDPPNGKENAKSIKMETTEYGVKLTSSKQSNELVIPYANIKAMILTTTPTVTIKK